MAEPLISVAPFIKRVKQLLDEADLVYSNFECSLYEESCEIRISLKCNGDDQFRIGDVLHQAIGVSDAELGMPGQITMYFSINRILGGFYT